MSAAGELHGITRHSQRITPEVISAQPAIRMIDAKVWALDLYGTLMPIIRLMTMRARPTAVTLFSFP